MKLNKAFLLIALPFIAQITMAVCCCDDEGNVIPPQSLSTCPLDSMTLRVLDNVGNTPVLSDADSVNKDAFGMRMELFSYKVPPTCYHQKAPKSLFRTAKAYSCGCNEYEPAMVDISRGVTDFNIITVNGLNAEYKANSDVTELFKEYKDNAVTDIRFSSLRSSDSKDYLLMQAPDSAGYHQFKIKIILNDTVEVMSTTRKVYLYEK